MVGTLDGGPVGGTDNKGPEGGAKCMGQVGGAGCCGPECGSVVGPEGESADGAVGGPG